MNLLELLTCVALAASASAQVPQQTSPQYGRGAGTSPLPVVTAQTGFGVGPGWSFTADGGDFVQASATTRTMGLVVPTQPCPFNVTLPVLPANAVVVESYACWNYLANSAPPKRPRMPRANPSMARK